MLGSESGASAIDRRGELVAAEQALLAEQPGLAFADFDAAQPAGWDGQLPGSIGPRHLEAAAATYRRRCSSRAPTTACWSRTSTTSRCGRTSPTSTRSSIASADRRS